MKQELIIKLLKESFKDLEEVENEAQLRGYLIVLLDVLENIEAPTGIINRVRDIIKSNNPSKDESGSILKHLIKNYEFLLNNKLKDYS